MAIFIFIAKLIVVSACLYGYYHLFLRNKRFHHYNRFYLLLVSLLSFIIACINIPVHFFWGNQPHNGLIQTLKVIAVSDWEEPVTIYAHPNSWRNWMSIQNGLYFVYLAGFITAVVAVLRSLAYINRLKNKYPFEAVDQLKIFNTAEPGTPFSFFKSIFWDKNIALHDARGEQILKHELFHVKQRHSADILLMEMLCCMAWFNPFLHLIKKELRTIHEFLADEFAVSGNNRSDYAELLLLRAIQQQSPAITHPFFHNQIKRRITMITQSNLIRRSGYFSRVMALPLLMVLVSAFAVKITAISPAKPSSGYGPRAITVVIDPGHGGIFPGTQNKNGLMEKNITLSLAQKIQALASSYNVNIVLTRSSDALVGSASNLREDLQNRIGIVDRVNPDLFVSIHVNSTREKITSLSGFDAYISARNAHTGNRELASTLLTNLKNIYRVNESIQQSEGGVVVLDKSNCPAVCLECGYITNPPDVAFITNPVNQEKVARKILEGIVQYSLVSIDQKETTQTENKLITDTSVLTGRDVKEQLRLAAKKQLDQSILEKANDKTFSVTGNKDTIPPSKDVIFTKIEKEADYPGGQSGWRKYLFEHLRYPQAAIDKNIQGTVVVQFIVDQEGKVSDVKAISGPDLLKAESMRIVKESGLWTSAIQNGKKVKAYKRQPITYKLERQG